MRIYHDKVHGIHIDLDSITAISDQYDTYTSDKWGDYLVYLKLHDNPLHMGTDKLHAQHDVWVRSNPQASYDESRRHFRSMMDQQGEEWQRLMEAWKQKELNQ